MTPEEAIRSLENMLIINAKTDIPARDMAIAALRRSRWIPVTERMPETDDKVLCCTRNKKGQTNIVIGYHYEDKWACGMNSNVVAWRPLPDPWKGDAND